MKWIVRADCRPPNRSNRNGASEVTAGDMVSPLSTIAGSSTKITTI